MPAKAPMLACLAALSVLPRLCAAPPDAHAVSLVRAQSSWQALQANFGNADPKYPNVFALYLPGADGSVRPNYVWPQGQVANAALNLGSATGDYSGFLAVYPTLSRYLETNKGTVGYAPPVDPGEITPLPTRWWDDNGLTVWVSLQAYAQLGDAGYLRDAQDIWPFFKSGQWLGGGQKENENFDGQSLSTGATETDNIDAALLYVAASSSDPLRAGYLNFAIANDAAIQATLLQSNGLYWGAYYPDVQVSDWKWCNGKLSGDACSGTWWGCNPQRGDLPTPEIPASPNVCAWTFNSDQAFVMELELLLYRITGQISYLQKAEHTASAALAFYTPDWIWVQAPNLNAAYFQALLHVAKYSGDQTARTMLANYLDRAWTEARDPNTGLFTKGGVGLSVPSEGIASMDQAGWVSMYSILAVASGSPEVDTITPSSGPPSGGQPVTISGAGFTGATAVTIGGNPATSFAVVNDNTISAVTPAGAAGVASVLVTTPNGASAANSLFSYNGGSTCTYALDPATQGFAAAGGSGAVAVTAGTGCAWSVFGNPAWVTTSGAASGTGNGTVSFQIAQNTSAARNATFHRRSGCHRRTGSEYRSVRAERGRFAGASQFAGRLSFELDAVNLGSSPATAQVNFTDPNGNPLPMPLTFPQTFTNGTETAASLYRTINPNARLVVTSTGSGSAASLIGSGQLLSSGNVSGFGIFSFPALNWSAVVPLENRKATTYSLPFDNTGNLATGVALANLAASLTTVRVAILSDTGSKVLGDTLTLTPQQFENFMLSQRYPQTLGTRGTIQFQTGAPGQLTVLGVRANGTAALTTLPVLSNIDTPGGSVSDLTYGGGFTSTFYLVNTGTSAASFTLNFFDQSGNPVNVPLVLPQTGATQTATALTQSLAPGQMLEAATQTSVGANISGSAQLTTSGAISGFEIFEYSPNGQEASVPLETRTPKNFILLHDNTNGLSTGVALANVSGSPANITANIYDDQGNLLASPIINLPGHGQQTIVLNSQFSITANQRGMVQFGVPTSGAISMIGIRVGTVGGVTTTTIPIMSQ